MLTHDEMESTARITHGDLAQVAPGDAAPSTEPTDWVTLVSPRIDEEPLAAELGIPPEFVAHALDLDELPRMRSGAGGTLIVLRVPVFLGKGESDPWNTHPFALILLPRRIVAVSSAPHPVLEQLAAYAKSDHPHQPRLVLHALELCAEAYLHEVRHINEYVDQLEAQLHAALGNREVLELLKCQKGFVYFGTALRAMELLLERLQKSDLLQAAREDQELLEDVRVELHQALDMTQTSGNILSEMMDAFASIISNNLNVVLKFLAAVTIVLMVPTLAASLWGMNVNLPLQRHPFAFSAIVGGSIGISLLVTVLLAKRRWL